MRRFLLIASLLIGLCIHTAYGQQGQNPFDILSDTPLIDTISDSKKEEKVTETKNVFDIENTIPLEKIGQEEKNRLPDDADDVSLGDSLVNGQNTTYERNPFDIVKSLPLSTVKKQKISKTPSQEVTYKKPLFTKNQKQMTDKKSVSFLFWPILLCIIALAFIINMKGNVLIQNINALTNDNVLKLNQRIENNGLTIPYIVLYLIFLIGSGIFLFLVLRNFSSWMVLSSFLGCLLFIIGVYIIRHTFLFFVGRVFDMEQECDQYNFTIVSYNILFGIFLIPLNLLLTFGPETITTYLLYIGIAVYAILFVIRMLRGIIKVLPIIVQNKFQFFTYLCTFEILPLLIFIKVVYL